MTLSQDTIDRFRDLEKGFMAPDIYQGPITLDVEHGPMPSGAWLDQFDPCDHASRIEGEIIGWLCRLSADGYLDCTDWCGPLVSEEECVECLVDIYSLD